MTPEQRADAEAHADRCVRRGDLSEALGTFRAILAAFPQDEALRRKLENLEASLQPAELMSAKAAAVRDPPQHASRPLTSEQEGERLFALGDFAGATAAYRRALKENPTSALVRERLEELFRLAQSAPRHSPTDVALPVDPLDRLQALLDRISARKRV